MGVKFSFSGQEIEVCFTENPWLSASSFRVMNFSLAFQDGVNTFR